jgi:predicted kinase
MGTRVYIPVGIVASGKSTACRQWAEKNDAVIVEADVFRTIFHRKYVYDPSTEYIIRSIMEKSTIVWSNHGVNVAVDDAVSFLSKWNRVQFRSAVKREAWNAVQFTWDFLPLPTDEEVVERRGREGRGYSVEQWLEVAHKQREELEYDG